jgi:hypothetical protein
MNIFESIGIVANRKQKMPRSLTLGILDHFRHFRHFSLRHFPSSQSGMAYMAILVLLAILSTLAFSFLFKTGTQTQATQTRGQSMQAHYLAESAANHALWGLLNQPGFAPASDVYYMHSLGNGRYGYKVRKPTETTFATVATVGAVGDNVVNQSYVQYIIPSNVLTAYARTTIPHVQYRRLIGANWTNPADTPDIPVSTVYWVEMEGCPVRKEIIMGTIDGQDDINLAVWDGTSWGNPHVFSTVNAGTDYKRFDIAYESQSGRALVVGRYDDTTTVRYNIWDGTGWLHATAQPAFNLAGGAARSVVMSSCPGNDQILIATVNSLADLQLFLWDGSVFTDLGVIETSTNGYSHGTVEIVYEQQSGDALVIWTRWGSPAIFCVWNGVTLGPENIVPIFPDNVNILRAASDPTSDHIVVAGIDKFYDVQVGIWDGTAWTDSREVETGCANDAVQGVDVAWEATGEDALVVWAPWDETFVRSLAWKKGAALADSTVEPGPDVQGQSWLIRLHPISQSEKIILLAETNSKDLRYSLWDGDRLKGDPSILLESNIPVQNQVAFDIAEANVPISGGTGSGGGGGNLAPVVDAGPDQTIYLPNDATLDGSVTDDGQPDPPATVTTTWTQESGPGTVTFNDASLVDTTAKFSEPGTYVLRLTADDFDLTDFDEVTITVSALCVGLVGYWELDETSGTLASDSSGNGNDGALVNMDPATDWVSGRLDGGLDFDGINDVVDLGSASNLEDIFDGGGTAAAWIYPVGWGEGGAGRIFSKQDAIAGNHSGWELSTYGSVNSLIFQRGFSSTIGTWVTPTNAISLNTWQHVAVVYDGSSDSNEPTFYINGVLQTATEIWDPPSGSPKSDAGMKLSLGNVFVDTGRTFDGIIDDARIYNRVLDSGEIAQIHALTEGGCGGGGGGGSDTDPPIPDPMTWASPPAAVDPSSITMTATTASDPSGVKYYFECTAGGGNDSGWLDSPTYVDSGLSPNTQYTYRVKASDKAATPNETGWSSEASATTLSNDIYVYDITMGFNKLGVNYFGQATVWIKGAGGANISGAVVSGDWSGAVSGSSSGNTGSDGKVMLESPAKKNGGTFTFTVTSVVNTGYTYNPSLNVETSDSITAP